MRQNTLKRAKLNRADEPFRRAKREKHGRCMNCGHSPENPRRHMPAECSALAVHEIGNGSGLRKLCQGKDYATLVLCWHCNQYEFCDKDRWPVARQLALLKVRAPEEYDLKAFVLLIRPNAPNWIIESEVDSFVPGIVEAT